jgi:hypothetical protein
MRTLGGLLLLVLILAMVSPAMGDGDDPSTGITSQIGTLAGQVLIGPTCPGPVRVDRLGQCQDKPYAATLSIQTPDGTQELTQVSTDDQGQFSVDLDPGSYLVVPLTPPGQILPRGIPQTVDVMSGQTTTITVQFDSGIR